MQWNPFVAKVMAQIRESTSTRYVSVGKGEKPLARQVVFLTFTDSQGQRVTTTDLSLIPPNFQNLE